MLLSVLSFKPSLENFLSQQRETQAHSAHRAASFSIVAEQTGNTAHRICEWTSVRSRVTMWLIDENLHCLCSQSQRSCCTKGVFHGAHPPFFSSEAYILQQVRIYQGRKVTRYLVTHMKQQESCSFPLAEHLESFTVNYPALVLLCFSFTRPARKRLWV